MNSTIDLAGSTGSADKREEPWPVHGLEAQSICPVCSNPDRALLHKGLADTIFKAAPGRWTMWRCTGCRSDYLDPRPTPDTIGLAYDSYYTHNSRTPPRQPTSLRTKLETGILNDYMNARFGTRERRIVPLGRYLTALSRRPKATREYHMRFLPRPRDRGRARLLDIGCGSGAFLDLATSAGWQAHGCDTDPKAVANAAAPDRDVRLGGAEQFAEEKNGFDAVTLSHVIEHVHDPADTLRQAKGLLRPGGQLFIDTPNSAALGHAQFGTDWRGLEPPRHLVLFNYESLGRLLEATSFSDVRSRPQPWIAADMWRKSERMRLGGDPYDHSIAFPRDFEASIPDPALIPADRTEYVTMTARA